MFSPLGRGVHFPHPVGAILVGVRTEHTHLALAVIQATGHLDLDEIASRLRAHGNVSSNRFMLRAALADNGREYELTLFTDGRAIVATGSPPGPGSKPRWPGRP